MAGPQTRRGRRLCCMTVANVYIRPFVTKSEAGSVRLYACSCCNVRSCDCSCTRIWSTRSPLQVNAFARSTTTIGGETRNGGTAILCNSDDFGTTKKMDRCRLARRPLKQPYLLQHTVVKGIYLLFCTFLMGTTRQTLGYARIFLSILSHTTLPMGKQLYQIGKQEKLTATRDSSEGKFMPDSISFMYACPCRIFGEGSPR